MDLIVLVADADQEAAMGAVLRRDQALGIRPIDFVIRRHPGRDSGCRVGALNFLSVYRGTAEHALVIFDQAGCGGQGAREEIEDLLEEQLSLNGWEDRARTVVIDPELERWVWSPSPWVDIALGWSDRQPSLREWLADRHLLIAGQIKPDDPKTAYEAALREVRTPRSPSVFALLASHVTLQGCADDSFQKLRAILAGWFGVGV